jgi:Zn-dependent protease with chaperone function
MGSGKTCLSVVVASLAIAEMSVLATGPIAKASQERLPEQTLLLSNSQNLLTREPGAFARFLKTARPAPVSAEDKARALSSLPEEGEVTNLNASARQKLAGLIEVLRATERDSVYQIKVIAVPQAAIGLHARAVILISEAALTLLDADELQALMAHELGHEYVWTERE